MTNTYAINTTRNKEFEVAAELEEIGANVWVPKRLVSKNIKERKAPIWHDLPYIPKLIFAVFPAVCFRDVCEVKHVIGQPVPLSDSDLRGTPSYTLPNGKYVPERPGLHTFQKAVNDEYAEQERRRQNAEYVCAYKPGQALQILTGAWADIPAVFRGVVKEAGKDYHKLSVEVQMMGQTVRVATDPINVGAAG